MFNLAISFSSSAAAYFILTYLTGYYQWGLVGGLLLFFGLNYLLSKRIMGRVESLMNQVSKELQNQRFDKAIRTLESGYGLGNWQFFVKPQLRGQIGVIHYLMKEDDKAFPYLKDAFSKHWIAMGMLGVIYMKRGDKAMMVKAFEKMVKATPKESLAWALYAFCMLKEGEREKALDILNRGLVKLPGDERLKSNQTLVANKQRMKMKNYGDMWTQFYLEKSAAVGQKVPAYMQALAQSQGRRRIIRR